MTAILVLKTALKKRLKDISQMLAGVVSGLWICGWFLFSMSVFSVFCGGILLMWGWGGHRTYGCPGFVITVVREKHHIPQPSPVRVASCVIGSDGIFSVVLLGPNLLVHHCSEGLSFWVQIWKTSFATVQRWLSVNLEKDDSSSRETTAICWKNIVIIIQSLEDKEANPGVVQCTTLPTLL